MKNNLIDKVYVIHYEPLTERKKYLDEQISSRFGFDNVEFIISNESSDVEILKKNNYVPHNKYFSDLTNQEICNYEVQYKIWNRIYKNGFRNVLIIEDDAIFNEKYDLFFPQMIQNLPSDYDICFLSECSNLYPNNVGQSFFVESETSRCCVAYLITNTACKKLISVNNFFHPIDHHLNFVKNNLNLKYYWSDPTVFNQGSEYLYKSNAGRGR